MPFNSFGFIFLFLPITLVGYHYFRSIGRPQIALTGLTVASLIFYSWGGLHNLPILVSSIAFNFGVSRAIGYFKTVDDSGSRHDIAKGIFVFGIASNLIFLSYFKYFAFLPLGISFFTIMQIMYLVDCYEGLVTPSKFRTHMLLVSFFPVVVMGPLLRVKEIIPQFESKEKSAFDANNVAGGVFLFGIGLVKKVVFADSYARIADSVFSSSSQLSLVEAWLGSFAFTLQLYFDFSGYSDMAVAIALLLGVTIPANFNSPFQSRSITEFWRRWHISLSSFITTYLYTPIVRSFAKITFYRIVLASFMSMLIAGVWHGSKWTFVVFGAMHGLGLVVNQLRKRAKKRLPDKIALITTMLYVNLTFIFFRANDLDHALSVIYSLFNFSSFGHLNNISANIRSTELIELGLPMLIGVLVVFWKSNSNNMLKEFTSSRRSCLFVVALFLISFLYMNSNMAASFLYVDF